MKGAVANGRSRIGANGSRSRIRRGRAFPEGLPGRSSRPDQQRQVHLRPSGVGSRFKKGTGGDSGQKTLPMETAPAGSLRIGRKPVCVLALG